MTTAAIILGLVLALGGLGLWISRRGEAKGRAETRVDVLQGTNDAAKAANEGRFEATLKDYSNDPMDRRNRG